MLHGKAMRSDPPQLAVLDPERQNPPSAFDAEREYRAHRDAVRAYVLDQYPEVIEEWETLYHEAWIELLQVRRRGEVVRSPRALLKRMVQHRAVDLIRKPKPDLLEPSSRAFEGVDRAPGVDEIAEIRLTAAALRQIIETLEPRQALMLKMRFDLRMGGTEIQTRMNLTRKRMEKLFTRAYKTIEAELDASDSGVSHWSRRQRSLLMVCELGIASPEQRARAEQLLANDVHCRAMLHAMRSAMRDVAVAVPLPLTAVEIGQRRGPIGAMLDHAEQALSLVRHPTTDVVASRSCSTLTEQATGSLAGGLGVGGAIKIVAACLAVGGTAAVCVHDVVERAPHRAGKAHKPKATKRKPTPVAQQPAPAPIVVTTAAQPTTGQRVRHTQAQLVARAKAKAAAERASRVPVSSPRATPPISPVPAGTTEFGPGGSGSDPVAPQPAPAPQDGGGEFGP